MLDSEKMENAEKSEEHQREYDALFKVNQEIVKQIAETLAKEKTDWIILLPNNTLLRDLVFFSLCNSFASASLSLPTAFYFKF